MKRVANLIVGLVVLAFIIYATSKFSIDIKRKGYNSASGTQRDVDVSKNNIVSIAMIDSNVNINKEKTRYLIYFCDNVCGGLADRERGIIYAFMASIQLDRKFGIIMTTPCDIQNFLVPNKYDWIIPESSLVGKPKKTINDIDTRGVDLSKDTTEVIYLRTNTAGKEKIYHQIHNKLPPYLKGATTFSDIYKLIWEFLMKPSPRIINHLKTFTLSRSMTCAHVRIGKSKNLPNDAVRNNVTDVSKIWNFMETFDKENLLFVATDNEEVRESARRRFGKRYFDTGGKIVHIDRQARIDNACLGFETAIIDQIILSKCTVLVVSFSGLSGFAAMLRNNSKNLYIFKGKGIKSYDQGLLKLLVLK